VHSVVKIDVVNASCAFSRPKGRPVILHNPKTVIPKNQITGLYSMLLFGLTDDQCVHLDDYGQVRHFDFHRHQSDIIALHIEDAFSEVFRLMTALKLNPLYQDVISQNALGEPVALVFHSLPPENIYSDRYPLRKVYMLQDTT